MGFAPPRLDRLDELMTGHTGPDATPGMVWLVDDGDDFGAFHLPQPVLDALGDAAGTGGPPAPQAHAPADDFLARMADIPLAHQPGERWLYHHSADLYGILIARATGRSLGEVLAERLLGLLGMADTGFSVPEATAGRLGPLFGPPVGPGEEREVYDPAMGWGFGLCVFRERVGTTFGPGSYGWDGGLGSAWSTDPTEGLVGILLTNERWSAPGLPPSFRDFWTLTYAALD